MIKLYKNINGVLHYWEAWDKNKKIGIIHWGIVGERGQDEEIGSGLLKSFKKRIEDLIEQKIDEGYQEPEDMCSLLIEYQIDGMGTTEDLEKRHRLENR